MNLMNLFAKLTLDSSQYEKGLQQSSKSASSFVSKLSTGFKGAIKVVGSLASALSIATGAIATATIKAINYGDEIDKNSQKLGLSAKAYQEWSLATQMAGSDTATLQTGIRSLSDWIGKLNAGEGEAIITSKALGIEFQDFVKKDFDEQLLEIVEAFQGMEDATQKTQLAQEIFGNRTYQELLPLLNQEKGSLQELFAEMEAGGQIIDDEMIKKSAKLSDQLEVLKTKAKTTATSFLLEFAPAISEVADGLFGLLSGKDDGIDSFADGIINLVDGMSEKLPLIIDSAIKLITKIFTGLQTKEVFGKIANGIVTLLVNGIVSIAQNISGIVTVFTSVLTSVFNALADVDFSNIISTLLSGLLNASIQLITNGEFWGSLLNLGLRIITGIFQGIRDFLFGENGVRKLLSELWENLKSPTWWKNVGIDIANGLIDGLNMLKNFLPGAFGFVEIPKIPKVEEYANGGMMDNIGTLYRAGEAGAEIVAQGSRGTGVANVEQIAEAQYSALVEYGLKETIQKAAQAIVMALEERKTARAYSKDDILNALVNGVNEGLAGQGRKTLNAITSF